MRTPEEKEYCHERLGSAFREALSWYDTSRRLGVPVDESLNDEMVRDKEVLEVGAGLGFFSERLHRKGARVTATDIGEGLLESVRQRAGCRCERVDALSLADRFGLEHFDLVVSSESIEHAPAPAEALRQMATVLRPAGYISVSTPNWLWYPVVRAATILRLRPFDGLENVSSFARIREALNGEGVTILREKGAPPLPVSTGDALGLRVV